MQVPVTAEQEVAEKPKTYEDGVNAERVRVSTLLLKEQQGMVEEYRALIKHTGGILTNSMVYAYSKGLNDVFKLIQRKLNEKSV